MPAGTYTMFGDDGRAVAVYEEDPRSLIWAPSPPNQAGVQPWDYALEVFESPARVVFDGVVAYSQRGISATGKGTCQLATS